MQRPSDQNENSRRQGIAVAVLTEDSAQQLSIQNRLEATHVAQQSFLKFSVPIYDQVQRCRGVDDPVHQ